MQSKHLGIERYMCQCEVQLHMTVMFIVYFQTNALFSIDDESKKE